MKMKNEIIIEYEGALRGKVRWPDGGTLEINAPTSCGGCSDASPSPKDLFLAGYASCVAMTMDIIGRKSGLDIAGAEVKVSAVWAGEKSVLRQVNTTVVLPDPLTEQQLDVLREGLHNCPIHNAIREDVQTPLAFAVGRAQNVQSAL